MEDRSQFRLQVSAPEGTAYDYMDRYMDKLAKLMTDSVPEKDGMISMTAPGFSGGSVNSGFIRVTLVPPSERKRSQQHIVDMVNRNLPKYNEGRASSIQEQTISVNRRGGQPVQFVLQNVNFDKIKRSASQIFRRS
jgi:multidrug efflux pump